jgi:hypothetical protein
MNLLLEIIFIALQVIFLALQLTDLILTYRCIKSGKGVEIGIFAKHYIKYPAAAIAITVFATGLLLLWLAFVNMVWMLIPAIAYKVWLVQKSIRVLHG